MQAELIRSIKNIPALVKMYCAECVKSQDMKRWYPDGPQEDPEKYANISHRCAAYILNKQGFVATVDGTSASIQNMLSDYHNLSELVLMEQHQDVKKPIFSFNMASTSFLRPLIQEDADIEDPAKNYPVGYSDHVHALSLSCFMKLFELTNEWRKGSHDKWDEFFSKKLDVQKLPSNVDAQYLHKTYIDAICRPYLAAIVISKWLQHSENRDLDAYKNIPQEVKDIINHDVNLTDHFPEWLHVDYCGKDEKIQDNFVINAIRDKSCRHIAERPKAITTPAHSPSKPSKIAKAAKAVQRKMTMEERFREEAEAELLKKKQRPNLIAVSNPLASLPPAPHEEVPTDTHVIQQQMLDQIAAESAHPPELEEYRWPQTKPRSVIEGTVNENMKTEVVDSQLHDSNISIVDHIVNDNSDVPTSATSFFANIEKAKLIISYVPSGASGLNSEPFFSRTTIDTYTSSYKSCLAESGTVVIFSGSNIENTNNWNQSMIAAVSVYMICSCHILGFCSNSISMEIRCINQVLVTVRSTDRRSVEAAARNQDIRSSSTVHS